MNNLTKKSKIALMIYFIRKVVNRRGMFVIFMAIFAISVSGKSLYKTVHSGSKDFTKKNVAAIIVTTVKASKPNFCGISNPSQSFIMSSKNILK